MAGKNVKKSFKVENEAEIESETRQRLCFMSSLHVKIILVKPVVNSHKNNRSWRFNLSHFLLEILLYNTLLNNNICRIKIECI